MTNKISTTKQGFTIIEVVLVLAIAGLIFLMVFVAFPALQRNQRDTQRRQDYANIASGIISSSANNNGAIPSGTISATYANKDGQDPDGNTYSITAASGSSVAPPSYGGSGGSTSNTVFVYTGVTCGTSTSSSGGTSTTTFNSGSAKDFIVYGYLENGGTFCGEYHL